MWRRSNQARPKGSWAALAGFAVLAALFFWGAPWLVVRAVVAPSVEDDRPAWQVQYYAGEKPSGPVLSQGRAAADAAVTLDRSDASLVAYGLLRTREPGSYRLVLECDDYGSIHLDGRPLLEMTGISPRNLGWAQVDLRPGDHLLRVDLHNGPGSGFFSLKVTPPGQTQERWPRAGELVRPDLGNVDSWWRVVRAAVNPNPALLGGLALAFILLALPLALRGGWRGGAAVALVLLGPALFIPGPPDKHPFEYDGIIRELRLQRPDYVFIGNSMVDSAIDFDRLNQLTGGGRAMGLTMGGSRVTVHFLFFKNVLLASGIQPKATFVVFRDNYLTNPLLRSQGGGMRQVFESLSQGEEPLLERLVYSQQPLSARVAGPLMGLLRVRGFCRPARAALGDMLCSLGLAQGSKDAPVASAQDLRDLINQRFGLGYLRPKEDEAAWAEIEDNHDGLYDPKLYMDFDKVVDSSFLPHFISLARERGLRLVFIRHQRRPDEGGRPPGEAGLERYMERMRDYLARQGVGFHDFTGDPEAPLALYGAGDHIADEAAARYTEVFFERMRGELLPLSSESAPR